MSKYSFPLSLIAISLSIFSFFYFRSGSDQVYVDVNRLVDGYKRTKLVRADFEKRAKLLTSNVDSLMVDWQNELKRYEQERSKMSKKELELKQELLGNKQQQIGKYQEVLQKQIEEEDKKSSLTIVNDINDYVKDYGRKKGYKIIFGASGSGTIMYANGSADLTEDVLIGLNKEFEGEK